MGLKPLYTKVLLKQIDQDLIIPSFDTTSQLNGIVVAVGSGENVNGKRVPLILKNGNKVIFRPTDAIKIDFEGEEYYLIEERDILAINL